MRLLLLLALCSALLAGCSARAEEGTVQGVLVAVDAPSLVKLDGITLRDEGGRTWQFAIAEDARDENGRPLSGSHLRQDMAGGLQVVVHYRREGDRLLALRVTHE